MSVKQFLLMALACALLTRSALSEQIICNDAFDADCCEEHDGDACSFKTLGVKFVGTCQDGDVSLLLPSTNPTTNMASFSIV